MARRPVSLVNASQALAMHGSVHYQQNGPTDFVTKISGFAGEGPAGKPSGVNAVIVQKIESKFLIPSDFSPIK